MIFHSEDNTMYARRSDPPTSHEAAHNAHYSGLIGRQCVSVYLSLFNHRGATSAELANHMNVDRALPARRLPELAHSGLIDKGASRLCNVKGTRAITWWPK